MRKKELIKALSKIEEGIADVKNLLLADEQVQTATSVAKKETKEKVEEKSDTVEGRFSREDLDAMKYNDLKKLGKELGIKCTGTREEITEKILAVPVEDNAPAEKEDEKSNVIPMKKVAKKKEERIADKEENSTDDDIDEQYLEMAREALDENDLEEVIEVLAEAGIKLTSMQKKKQDVVMRKLAEAFQNGMIDVDEDEEDGEDSDAGDNTENEDDLDFSEDSYFDQYDPEGINDPDSMTKKRAKAIKTLVADIIAKFEGEELTSEDIENELEDIITEEDAELLGDNYSEEELVAFYIEMKKRFVDNEGDLLEPSDPYEIGDSNFCCGHELVYDKKGKKYVCPICEEEYEAE